MTGTFCAFLDASVLYPASLRNLLMRLTLNGLFQARWSADVHEEWIRAVLRDRPDIPRERLHQIRDAMNERAEDALVTGYQALIDGLHLPDLNDRHVLAAAIVGHADVIVTRNLRDFPPEVLDRYDIEAQHPDEFIRHLLDLSPVLVVDAIRDQQASLTKPPIPMPELLDIFESIGLAETVAELRRIMGDI
jgi:hypothetical protein